MKNEGTLGSIPFLLLIVGIACTVGPPAAFSQTAAEELADQDVTDAIEDEILFDRAVPFNSIDVETHNGVVMLNGTVDNILARERAARIAETVKGVRSVINQIEVDPSDPPSDYSIRRNIEAALLEDPATDSYEVDVAVHNGAVTLTGTVDSWQEKNLADKVAKGVKGVIDVNNTIEVDYKSQRSDSEIKAEIGRKLRWDVLVADGLINVAVNNGKIELTGTVGSAAEKRRARIDAWVAGVHSVDTSGLDVERWARDEDLRKDKYVARSDEELRRAVEDALLYDPRVNSLNVTTEVSAGVVALRGKVDGLEAKRAAAQDARNTVGVWSVDNRLKGRPPGDMADELVAANILDAFERDPYVDRYEILVTAADGVAYLSGTVDSYFEKARADDIASRIPGVVEVRNNISVNYTDEWYGYEPYVDNWYAYDYDWYDYEPGYSLLTDREIKEEIEDELWWSPFVDAGDVTVSVEDGVATLTGAVDSWSERNAATENAYEGGAVWVRNQLALK